MRVRHTSKRARAPASFRPPGLSGAGADFFKTLAVQLGGGTFGSFPDLIRRTPVRGPSPQLISYLVKSVKRAGADHSIASWNVFNLCPGPFHLNEGRGFSLPLKQNPAARDCDGVLWPSAYLG